MGMEPLESVPRQRPPRRIASFFEAGADDESAITGRLARGEWRFEATGLDPNGRHFPTSVVAAPLARERGSWVKAFIVVVQDLSAEVERQAAVRVAREKDLFLANLSHELRTPLNGIVGFVEILADGGAGPVNAEQSELLADVRERALHLTRLIDDLLLLTKISSEKGASVSTEASNLRVLLDRVVSKFDQFAASRGASFVVNVGEGVCRVRCDERLLERALAAVLENSVKFSPRGATVHVRAWTDEQGGAVLVKINNPGRVPADSRRLLSLFEQGTKEWGDKPAGLGTGLFLAKKIVELHGGILSLESGDDGVTVTLKLPADGINCPAGPP
ncbi:MAG: hypothetical protein Kow0069_33730 [Promethearchaeota archaeon]